MILIVDTSDSKLVWIALKNDKQLIQKLEEENQYGSQVLLPLITKLLEANQLTWSDLKSIEVVTGPGSFTGLRVGVSVAQALGFALDVPVNGHVGKQIEIRYT